MFDTLVFFYTLVAALYTKEPEFSCPQDSSITISAIYFLKVSSSCLSLYSILFIRRK